MGRIGAALTLLPGLGEASPPPMLRVGLAIGITVLLLPGIAPLIPAVPADVPTAAGMIAAEVVTGLWLGWLARLLVLALPIAGQLIAFMLGVSNVLVTDPELSAQSSALEQIFSLAAPLALLISGLYAVPLAALAGSYDADQAGRAVARRGRRRAGGARGRAVLRAGAEARLTLRAGRGGLARGPRACCRAWCQTCRCISSPCRARSLVG